MTQQPGTTADGTATIPAQRARAAHEPAQTPVQPTGWAALRRGLAVLRGARSLASVPARPQPGYGEVDGQ
jgi:hypothetical protein